MSDQTHDILTRATVRAGAKPGTWEVALPPGQLARPVYEAVAEVLQRLWGKWAGGRTQAFVFQYDVRPGLAAYTAHGMLPEKNPLDYFPTPASLAATMAESVGLNQWSTGRLLEPSAGQGSLLDAAHTIAPEVSLVAVELDPLHRQVLLDKGYPDLQLEAGDFLQRAHTLAPVQYVLMNPPFTAPGDPFVYMAHIRAAWDLLAPGGKLAAIAPAGLLYRSDKKSREFRNFVAEHGEMEPLLGGVFKESGTGVETVLINLDWGLAEARRRPRDGYHCWHCWNVAVTMDSTQEFHRALERAETPADVLQLTERCIKQEKLLVHLLPECHKELARNFLTNTVH